MEGTVCTDHNQNKIHPAHQLYLSTKKSQLRDLDIPPRKLLSRRLAALSSEPTMEFYQQLQQQQDSPKVLPEETLFQKFLPYNSGADADGENPDPYSSDHFRMYEFKVRKCTRSRSHDWTDCPFAHPGEKARRRCPRRYVYSGTVCPDYRRGSCGRGDLCEFAHGVFECWLHPSRYRTEACKDGKNCQRKICFFAHTPKQLRVLPVDNVISPKGYVNSGHGCVYCRCHSGIRHSASPTSTLNFDMENLSPPSSPPFSPAQSGAGYSPISRFADRFASPESCVLITTQSMTDIMTSMDGLSLNDVNVPNSNPVWLDAGFNGGGAAGGDDQQQQLVLSPSNPRLSGSGQASSGNEDKLVSEGGPDFGWVNDLLT